MVSALKQKVLKTNSRSGQLVFPLSLAMPEDYIFVSWRSSVETAQIFERLTVTIMVK